MKRKPISQVRSVMCLGSQLPVGLLLAGLGLAGCASDAASGGATAGAPSSGAGASAAGAPGTSGASSTGGAGSGGAPSTAGNTNGGAQSGAGAANVAGGSGGGSSGSVGAGGSSAGAAGAAVGGAPQSSCAGVNAKFCEDWDKLPTGKPTGEFSVSSGVVVDTTKAYSGTQSLHFTKLTKPASGMPFLNFTKQFPLASNDMHGRVMYFMAQTPKTGSHWNFITSSNSGNTEWSIGGQGGVFELVCDPPDHGLDSKTQWPGGKWVCMQWEFKYPGNDNTTFVTKVDGVSVDKGEFTGANSQGEKWKAGTWGNLKFGWEVFGSSDVDVEFWLDDLAFGEQIIPCPTAK